jgi:hypothetical protein
MEMTDRILTIKEIKNLFPDEWVLLSLVNALSKSNEGIVLFHSKDYLELCYKGSEMPNKTLTKIFYTGEKKQNRKWLKLHV